MESIITKHHKNVATVLHASAFSSYFIPFGNFIVPFILWNVYKKETEFIDHHGKEVLNFQLSLFCYKFAAMILAVPFFVFFGLKNHHVWDTIHFNSISIHWNDGFSFYNLTLVSIIVCIVQLLFFAINITYTIVAAMKANEGEKYRYPLTIRFIK